MAPNIPSSGSANRLSNRLVSARARLPLRDSSDGEEIGIGTALGPGVMAGKERVPEMESGADPG